MLITPTQGDYTELIQATGVPFRIEEGVERRGDALV